VTVHGLPFTCFSLRRTNITAFGPVCCCCYCPVGCFVMCRVAAAVGAAQVQHIECSICRLTPWSIPVVYHARWIYPSICKSQDFQVGWTGASPRRHSRRRQRAVLLVSSGTLVCRRLVWSGRSMIGMWQTKRLIFCQARTTIPNGDPHARTVA
jgi:hypothetical protein